MSNVSIKDLRDAQLKQWRDALTKMSAHEMAIHGQAALLVMKSLLAPAYNAAFHEKQLTVLGAYYTALSARLRDYRLDNPDEKVYSYDRDRPAHLGSMTSALEDLKIYVEALQAARVVRDEERRMVRSDPGSFFY